MKIDIVTIFPEYFAPLDLSLLGKARSTGLLEIAVHDLRRWTYDVHRTVDDSPYGGGAGMVMRPEPWGEALDAVAGAQDDTSNTSTSDTSTSDTSVVGAGPRGRPRLIVPSPAGAPLTHALAADLATERHLVFACGRYEGVDQRVVEDASTRMRVTEVSIGDYVLFGGEVAVLVIIETLTRLIPGVLGNAASLDDESHTDGLLESPVYTKPPVWRGHAVPDVLRSGDHGRIARWRRDQALRRTAGRRPDLLRALRADSIDRHDAAVLAEIDFDIANNADSKVDSKSDSEAE
jgi:tRNA (guanine37-N1)-methyltransferase